MPFDTYTIYCQWCIDHHRPPPTREWWDRACAQPRPTKLTLRRSPQADFEFDIETERREGYAYD